MRIKVSKISVFRMGLKRLKLQQFFDGVTRNFSYTQACKITPVLRKNFANNGVVLHHQATLFDNTNAVSKPEHGDQIVRGVLYSAKHLRILPNCK